MYREGRETSHTRGGTYNTYKSEIQKKCSRVVENGWSPLSRFKEEGEERNVKKEKIIKKRLTVFYTIKGLDFDFKRIHRTSMNKKYD